MNDLKTVCLLNDSFSPLIDGVANAVANYAKYIPTNDLRSVVVTPSHPQAEDIAFPYPVLRYPSINFPMLDGYTAGIPFSPDIAHKLSQENVALLHTHCPIISTFMARQLRQIVHAPIILTYHTKFDIEIEGIIKSELIRSACKRALVENINACDEVWVVSNGAGDNLRSIGYRGDYFVMSNGVDFPLGRVSEENIQKICADYDFPDNIPVYIFVGRMRWYKGIRIIIDALAQLRTAGKDFRMIFIGDGDDMTEIQAYATDTDVMEQCVFTGAIHQREILQTWYCKADLLLFPSTFDTNGLVVREAAACALPAVLIRGSCAAEGVTDGQSGFLIEENAQSLSACLLSLYGKKNVLYQVGQASSRELYISWENAVANAVRRYEIVMEQFKRKKAEAFPKPIERLMKLNGELMDALGALSARRSDKE